MIKSLFVLALFFCTHFVFAAVIGSAKVHGVIVKYNKKTVTLNNYGTSVEVSKSAIPNYFKIQTGRQVYAVLKAEEVMKKVASSSKP